MPEKPQEVGFPDGQFMAHGVNEEAALELAECWKTGNVEKASEIITQLPEELQPKAERIYHQCTRIQPREGFYE